jgi:hypothetical protein
MESRTAVSWLPMALCFGAAFSCAGPTPAPDGPHDNTNTAHPARASGSRRLRDAFARRALQEVTRRCDDSLGKQKVWAARFMKEAPAEPEITVVPLATAGDGLVARVVLFSAPTNSTATNADRFKQLVAELAPLLNQVDVLVVDLRDNQGGNSDVVNPLFDVLKGRRIRTVASSAGARFRRASGRGWTCAGSGRPCWSASPPWAV